MNRLIRVLLADDHAVVRKGIREFLEEDPEIVVVAEAGDGGEAFRLVGKHIPTSRCSTSKCHASPASRPPARSRPRSRMRVLILTAYEDDPYVFALLRAVRTAISSRAPIPMTWCARSRPRRPAARCWTPGRRPGRRADDGWQASWRPAAASEQVEPLSERELDVLRLAGQGLTNKAIGLIGHQRSHRPGAPGEHLWQAGCCLPNRSGDQSAQVGLDRVGRQVAAMLRRLRGLRPRLLLWTIVPLAVVLIILSLVGITRHRQAMSQLVEDRNRGLALAEANRLGREIDGRAALLLRRATDHGDIAQGAGLTALADDLQDAYSGGLALFDADARPIAASVEAHAWADSEIALTLAARTVTAGQPQFHSHFDPTGPDGTHLLIGVPLTGGRALIGAIPTETLSLAESSAQVETETHGAVFVLDATGQMLHHHNPGGLAVDEKALADLAVTSAGSAGATELQRRAGPGLLVTYVARWRRPRLAAGDHISSTSIR